MCDRYVPGIPTGRTPHFTESLLDGIPTGRNPHQTFMYWLFRSLVPGIPTGRNPTGRNTHWTESPPEFYSVVIPFLGTRNPH